MKHVYGRYEVVDTRAFRSHEQGTIFEARLEANAERRAVARGSIQLLERVFPALAPGSFTFPQGWLDAAQSSQPRKEA
jgi:hypothetical protein